MGNGAKLVEGLQAPENLVLIGLSLEKLHDGHGKLGANIVKHLNVEKRVVIFGKSVEYQKSVLRVLKEWGTHHSFYLLGAEVVHDSGAVLSESCSVSQKSIDGDLGGHPDVRQVNAFVAPLRNVE